MQRESEGNPKLETKLRLHNAPIYWEKLNPEVSSRLCAETLHDNLCAD